MEGLKARRFPPPGQSPEIAGKRFQGVWAGRFPDSQLDGVFLTLDQEENRLVGEGAIFRNDNPQPLHASGTATDQMAILDLTTESAPGGAAIEHDRLVLKWNGSEATGTFSGKSLPQGIPLALSRPSPQPPVQKASLRLWANLLVPFSTLNPAEEYRVSGTINGVPCEIGVQLTETDQYEFLGSWQALSPGGNLALGFTAGRATAANNLWGDWSRIAFHDDTAILPLGVIWFRRLQGGQAGTSTPIDPDSHLNHARGFLPLSGSVTLVRP